MPSIEVYFTPQLRDVGGRFAKAEGTLLETRRNELRDLARILVGHMKEEAPKGETGQFAEGIHYRTFVQDNILGFETFSPMPLAQWIVGGTDPHPIPLQPKTVGALAFYWEDGPHGPGTYFFKQVQHPGTDPNPYPSRAMEKWLPEAEQSLRRMALSYVTAVVE